MTSAANDAKNAVHHRLHAVGQQLATSQQPPTPFHRPADGPGCRDRSEARGRNGTS